MRSWLAGLAAVEVQRLHVELAHVRETRAQATWAAAAQYAEVLRLRARVEQLENLLLNPNTLKETE